MVDCIFWRMLMDVVCIGIIDCVVGLLNETLKTLAESIIGIRQPLLL
jgi:hypothetical protein